MEIITQYKTLFLITIIIIIIIFIGTPHKHKSYDFNEIIEQVRIEALEGKKEAIYPVFIYYIKNQEYDKCSKFYYKLIINNDEKEISSLLQKATIKRGLDISICQKK